jgi:hypothetical protein
MSGAKNMSELIKQISNSNLIKRNTSNIKNSGIINSNQVLQIVKDELKILEQFIKEEIQNYKESYRPNQYIRTGNWENSIYIEEPVLIGNKIIGKIKFNDLAYHKSYIGENQPDGFVPWLMEVGWNIESKVQPRRPRFTDYEGSNYISKAIKKFNNRPNVKKYKIRVNVHYNDSAYI